MASEEATPTGPRDQSGMSDVNDALLRRCRELGMTADEITAAGDDLVEEAVRRIFVHRGEQFTVADVAQRAGISQARVEEFVRAIGIAEPGGEEVVFTGHEMELISNVAPAFELLGQEASLQLLRVSAAAVARIGDSVISSFSTGAGARALRDDQSGLRLLEANLTAVEMLPPFGDLLTLMLTRHFRQGYRQMSEQSLSAALIDGVDTSQMAIGFADLVGSTTLAGRRSLAELNSLLDSFEQTAAETVRAKGGRVVKFIGDEVMFRADSADAACVIGVNLVDILRADALLPPVRVGIAFGDVLTRAGDFYGPTVNLAARVTKLAPLHGVVTTLDTTDALTAPHDFTITSLGAIEVHGLAAPVELATVAPPATP